MASTSTKACAQAILTLEQRKMYAGIFTELDTDGNGWLCRAECREWLLKADYGLQDRQLEAIFRLIDVNMDGRITLDEFFAIIGLVHQPPRKNTLAEKYFKEMDLDKDGYLSVEELHEGLKKNGHNLTLSKVKKFVANLDKNGDGKVSFSEFLAAFQ